MQNIYQVLQKSNPFLNNAWNFSIKFRKFMWRSYLHLIAMWRLKTFKHDEVIEYFNVTPPSDFHTLKNVWVKTQQNSVSEPTQRTLCLMFDSHFVCSNCSSPVFVHLFSHSVKLLTALLIGSWGRLSQITCNSSLSLVIDLGFGWNLWTPASRPRHGTGSSYGLRQVNLEVTDSWIPCSWPEARDIMKF